MAALSRLASTGGLPAPNLSPATLPVNPSTLIETASRRFVSDADLETGALGNELVVQAWTVLCYESEIESWLPTLCAPMDDDQALLALRKRVIRDIARLPSTALDKLAPQLPPEARESLRLASAVLDTLTQSVELYHLAKRMAHDTVSDVGAAVRDPCSLNDIESPLRRRPAERVAGVGSERLYPAQQLGAPGLSEAGRLDPMVLASRVLLRILQDGPALDRPNEYYARVVENELRLALGNPGWAMSPVQRQAAEGLMRAIRAARAIQVRMPGSVDPKADLVELARVFSAVVEHAASLAMDRHVAPPPAVVDVVAALVSGQLERAADLAASLVPRVQGGPMISVEAVSTLHKAIRLASVRNGAGARRVALGMLLPIGPWSERYLFDVNGGALKLQEGDTKLTGDMQLGYADPDWGLSSRGAFGYYSFESRDSRRKSETETREGELDGWLTFDLDESWIAELRGNGALAKEQTDLVQIEGQAPYFTYARTQSESTFYRAVLLGGIRYQPDLKLAMGLWIGAGLQSQRFTPFEIRVDLNDMTAKPSTLSEETDDRFMAKARYRFQYAVLPMWLSLRARVDLNVFDVKTTAFSVLLSNTGWELQNASSNRARQLELGTRVFIDFEVARLFRFVPSVWAGLDYVRRDSSSETLASTIPALGMGIRRDVF